MTSCYYKCVICIYMLCSKADILMISSSEFYQPRIVRIVAIRCNINKEQTGAAGRGRGGGSTRYWRNQRTSPRDGVPSSRGERGPEELKIGKSLIIIILKLIFVFNLMLFVCLFTCLTYSQFLTHSLKKSPNWSRIKIQNIFQTISYQTSNQP